MNSNCIQFIVNATSENKKGEVMGRCGARPIHIGDVFSAVVRYRKRKYPDEVGEPAVAVGETPVVLRVAHIHAYDNCLDELGQGMTGSLVLDGEGLQFVAAGAVLESSSPS